MSVMTTSRRTHALFGAVSALVGLAVGHLAATLISLKNVMPGRTRETARAVVRLLSQVAGFAVLTGAALLLAAVGAAVDNKA